MNNLALIFIGLVLVIMAIFFNTDFSDKKEIAKNIKNENRIVKEKKDVKIIFEDKKLKNKPKKVVKKVIKESKPVSVKGMFVLSKANVGDFAISLEVPQKPKVNKFAPPSFPTFIKGEINGDKFSLTLPNSAKKEDIFLTITTKKGEIIKVNANTLKDTKPGALIDVGNLTPPEKVEEDKKEEVAKDIEQKVEDSVEESKNSEDQDSNSIAPPMPPAIR